MTKDRPLRDYGMVGNGRTAALVSRDGSIDWCCFPRFDSSAVFYRLLDAEKGAYLAVRPTDGEATVAHHYVEGTNVLRTLWHVASGQLQVTDFMPLPAENAGKVSDLDCAQVIRRLDVLEGEVQVQIQFRAGLDYGRLIPEVTVEAEGCRGRSGNEQFAVGCPALLSETRPLLFESRTVIRPGESQWLSYCYSKGHEAPFLSAEHCKGALERTIVGWRDWIGRCHYEGRFPAEVRRSALVLKSLIYQPTGAMIASPASSLPERMGSDLNWDFRFAWLRDSGLVVDVLQCLGYHEESIDFLNWLERLSFSSTDRLQPVYRVDGSADLPEEVLPHLAGYRKARPVRIGNAASKQFQLDVLGHVAQAAWLCYKRMPRRVDPELWETLKKIASVAVRDWKCPDRGIWEERGEPRHYVHSKAHCWLALDSVIHLSERFELAGDTSTWRRVCEEIRQAVLAEGYDSETGAFRQAFGEKGIDATALVLPLMGIVPIEDPRVERSIDQIRQELSTGNLISRRRSSDLKGPDDGAFLLCNFWLVEVLARTGRLEQAEGLFHRLLSHGNDLGLFPEEVDPDTGEWLGPFPIGFTHLGLIRSAMTLDEVRRRQGKD